MDIEQSEERKLSAAAMSIYLIEDAFAEEKNSKLIANETEELQFQSTGLQTLTSEGGQLWTTDTPTSYCDDVDKIDPEHLSIEDSLFETFDHDGIEDMFE